MLLWRRAEPAGGHPVLGGEGARLDVWPLPPQPDTDGPRDRPLEPQSPRRRVRTEDASVDFSRGGNLRRRHPGHLGWDGRGGHNRKDTGCLLTGCLRQVGGRINAECFKPSAFRQSFPSAASRRGPGEDTSGAS